MILTIDLQSNRPLFIQIADAVKQGLVGGTIKPGDSLPPGRDLAAALDVSLETTQRAYRLLAEEGVVTSRVGRGTRVVDSIDPEQLGVDTALSEVVAQAARLGLSRRHLHSLIDAAYDKLDG